jgi:small Trp-rich protein
MWFLGIGLVLIALKYLEIGPVATWSWWWVLTPLVLASAWWAWADWSGYTKRKAMEKMEQRKKDRLAKNREALGMGSARRK